ncbi:hypothetical protein [Streptomyces sp. S4.7]|uniref:hypothetical protein n=1 Tax=Streptomyces sp. S4.7 TaxID=2705439 RepID=UPI0013DD06E7|nr:hypothetical protein [Streptomyces sp. S4.7]
MIDSILDAVSAMRDWSICVFRAAEAAPRCCLSASIVPSAFCAASHRSKNSW